MIRYISIIILLILTSGLYAQKPDSTGNTIKQWTLSSDFTEEVIVPFDTVFSLFHRYRHTDRYSFANASLGNYGLPFYQLNFFDRVTDPDKFLYNYYYPLMFVPDRVLFMNTQVPFTEVVWTYGTPTTTSEQTFRIKHSQNVNRNLNFGVVYDIVFSLGQYNYQRSEDKAATLFSSYTGDRYKMYFSTGLNNIISLENGGITDSSQLGQFVPREVQVNLGDPNKARSTLKNRNFLLVQQYKIGGVSDSKVDTVTGKKAGFMGLSGTFSHIFTFENNRRSYSDNSPRSGFYDSAYINSQFTFDSLSERTVKNTLRFDFLTNPTRKFRLGGGFGIRNEFMKYSQIIPTHDTMFADTASWKRISNAVLGKLFNNIGDNFRWLATGELFLTGYRAGDFRIEGEIAKSFDWNKGKASWVAYGSMLNTQPSFWYGQWGGNHFEWSSIPEKEFRINLGTKFSYPARKAELKFDYSIIDNYTDFNTMALPEQHSGALSVAAVTVSKELKAWKFHLNSDVLFQQSSNSNTLDLPFVTVRSAGFFEHLFKFEQTNGALNLQVGADVTMHSSYYPYAYMPATGRFYRQERVKSGNYPFLNAFINIKIKRTRAFLMFDHVNSGMTGYDYFMIPTYPMNIRMFRYGIAWTFYN